MKGSLRQQAGKVLVQIAFTQFGKLLSQFLCVLLPNPLSVFLESIQLRCRPVAARIFPVPESP